MNHVNVTEASKDLSNLIDKLADSHEPLVITGKRSNAILLSQEDWTAIQETLYLLSIPDMRESIREGMNIPVDACETDIDWE